MFNNTSQKARRARFPLYVVRLLHYAPQEARRDVFRLEGAIQSLLLVSLLTLIVRSISVTIAPVANQAGTPVHVVAL